MKKIIQALSAIALLVLLVSNGTSALAQDDVTVSINAPVEVVVDSDFTARVDVTTVTDFDGGNFIVSFDSSVLRLDNVSNGQIGSTVIPVSIWNEISPGKCIVLVNIPGLTGVSGAGYLAEIHFHVIGSSGSSSNIQLSQGYLNNNLAAEITAKWIGDSVVAYEQLVINTTDLPDGTVGSAYSASLQATGGDESYIWSIISGDLPEGIALSATGQISGIPITGGTFSFTIEAFDGGLSESKEYIVTIINPGDANQDNRVNTADITNVERIIIGLDDMNAGADVNRDGTINTADITKIEMYIFGLN